MTPLRFSMILVLCLAFFVGFSGVASTLKRGVPRTGHELLEITGNFVVQGTPNYGYVLLPTDRDWYLEGIQCANITNDLLGDEAQLMIQSRTSSGAVGWINSVTSGVNTYAENVTKTHTLGSNRLIPSGGYLVLIFAGSECTATFSEV